MYTWARSDHRLLPTIAVFALMQPSMYKIDEFSHHRIDSEPSECLEGKKGGKIKTLSVFIDDCFEPAVFQIL